jgi:hypothetical protein
MNWMRFVAFTCALLAVVLFSCQPAWSQANVGSGSVQGAVTDQLGGAIPNAKVIITNTGTQATVTTTTNSAGQYSSGSLPPGVYTVHVKAASFKTTALTLNVEVDRITGANVKLELGSSSSVIEVTSDVVAVNTEQASVGGVLNAQQIENLPVNGRNFLDLAQLEPGVQIQDGENFDPTKAGFSSISFGGRFGRTARIEVDGMDVSDETVGTTTTSIPASAISEFQVAQSNLDLSNELTSSGALNVVTKSGTNSVHGEAYGTFRDSSIAAALPSSVPVPFQRSQFGGDAGGPIMKDKLFFFMDAELTRQHSIAPAPIPSSDPLSPFSGAYNSPFKETDLLGKMDYNLGHNARLFARYSYFQNLAFSTFGQPTLQPFQDKNYTRSTVVGTDFTTGSYTHSIRFEYLKFQNELVDAVRGSTLPFADFPLSITIGPLATGPNLLAPQTTPQSDHAIKYDGSKIWGSHIIRYGISYNHIQGGGFAKFFSITPNVFDSGGAADQAFAAAGTFVCPGGQTGAACPFNYPVDSATVGNGLGFSTEHPAFGFPLGGLGPDNRLGAYIGDSYKVKANLTVTLGVRYVRDTDRTDSDLNTIQVLNEFLPGEGNPVKQPNNNLGPQLGVAWDPKNDGKTVIRAGIGIFYENVIWNNVLFDRPGRLSHGGFLAFPTACSGGTAFPVNFANDANPPIPTIAPVGVCGDAAGNLVPIGNGSPGTAAALLAKFQTQYQAAAAAAGGAAPNPSFIGNLIGTPGDPGRAAIPLGTFAPDYKTPRSLQMNVGVEREIIPGMKVSADYVRNVATHYPLSIDVNHTGDAALLNVPAAQAAIATTLAACGQPDTSAGITAAASPGGCTALNPISATSNGAATIFNFAAKGLDSPGDLFGGGSCPGNKGFQCAFGGINPLIGAVPLLEPIGRSVYNAFDVKLVSNLKNPMPGVKNANFQVSYTLSRFINSGGQFSSTAPGAGSGDQDFVITALDNNKPLALSGPSTLDRTNQLNFGGYLGLPASFRLGFVSHFWSPLPTSIQVPTLSGFTTADPGEIFLSNFNGSGTVGDLLPGTKVGSFGRGVGVARLTTLINDFNAAAPTMLLPSAQALVTAGLFTPAQLLALGAHPKQLAPAPAGQVSMGGLRAFDLSLAWDGKIKERITVTPSVTFYNLFNLVNYDLPTAELLGSLSGATDSINGTPRGTRNDRVGSGTGVFGLGAPRVVEFGLKILF